MAVAVAVKRGIVRLEAEDRMELEEVAHVLEKELLLEMGREIEMVRGEEMTCVVVEEERVLMVEVVEMRNVVV